MLDLKSKSFRITAEVEIPDGGATGVLLAQGGNTGGWSLYLDADGHLAYTYSYVGALFYTATTPDPVPGGTHQLRVEFAHDGGGIGKGGLATLYLDGQAAGTTRVERTHITLYSFDETTDVGRDSGARVTDAYPNRDNAFTGTIRWVKLETGDDDHSHLIDPGIAIQALMTQQ
jgi:arylsulfatase